MTGDVADVPCEYCKTTEGVQWESSRTMYHYEPPTIWERLLGTWKSPNADVALCRDCAFDHHCHWDEQWAEVAGNR